MSNQYSRDQVPHVNWDIEEMSLKVIQINDKHTYLKSAIVYNNACMIRIDSARLSFQREIPGLQPEYDQVLEVIDIYLK
jgi:hypothetical protein